MKKILWYTIARGSAVAMACICLGHQLIAQDKKGEIVLLDEETSQPVFGANYTYGSQDGSTDPKGTIRIDYTPEAVLEISHLSYGSWTLSPDGVLEALADGVLYRKQVAVNMQPVTVIALRQEGQLQSIKLDQEDLLSHDGGAILNRTPLISSIRKSANYGFDPVMRGFKYEQLNVVINGAQTAIAACPNRMDPPTSQIAPNMMEQIEIYKGPHSMRYGNSFGGTINFVLTPSRFSELNNTYGRISGIYEGNGNLFRTEGMVGHRNHRMDGVLFASWATGGDYTDGDGAVVPADFKRGSIGANVAMKLKPDQELRLSATRNFAREVEFPALPMDLRSDDTWLLNMHHQLRIERDLLKSWNTTVYATFVDHFMDNALKSLEPRTVNAETDARTMAYGGRSEGTWRFNRGKLYAGVDLRVEKAKGERSREFLMGPNAGKVFTDNVWQKGSISRTGVFAEYHLMLKGITWTASGRVEVNRSTMDDPEPEFSEVYEKEDAVQINPGISIGGTKSFGKGFSLALWLGRAHRSGSLTERFINYFPVGIDPYEMLGNPQIDPEVNNQADLEVSWKSGGTALGLDVFAAYLQDYVSSEIDTTLTPRLPNRPGVRQYVNISEALMTGFECTWQQRLLAGLSHKMAVAYTYGQDLVREQPLPEVAPLDFRYSLVGQYLNGRLLPEITYRHVLNQNRVSSAFGETDTPSFHVVDLRLSYNITKSIKCSAGIRNLLNETYYEHLSRSVLGNMAGPIYEPGRNAFISCAVDFR